MISIHALLAESDDGLGQTMQDTALISIHALLAESDAPGGRQLAAGYGNFYPRSPCGERQARRASRQQPAGISIHALLAESDLLNRRFRAVHNAFLSTLSLRRATVSTVKFAAPMLFLSTLSLRRATLFFIVSGLFRNNFYPRSPCGERRMCHTIDRVRACISIHALLAESDPKQPKHQTQSQISIHALLAESDDQGANNQPKRQISIHALLAESDNANLRRHRGNDDFYPRSPCGERRKSNKLTGQKLVFLSTLSLRRATGANRFADAPPQISIHALLAESDPPSPPRARVL